MKPEDYSLNEEFRKKYIGVIDEMIEKYNGRVFNQFPPISSLDSDLILRGRVGFKLKFEDSKGKMSCIPFQDYLSENIRPVR